MPIRPEIAKAIFREEAESSTPPSTYWVNHVSHLSQLCAAPGGAMTHIAFIGTAMLAKATDPEVDLYAIKPKHSNGNPNAYSARSLCHSVLVPLSAEYGVSIGVNGREPLNNQPYFRMNSLGDDTPVHGNARVAFDYMLGLVRSLEAGSSQDAKEALRAYIAVRRGYQTIYPPAHGVIAVTATTLASAIQTLVQENSEGGRRAQAAVAGLLDVFAHPHRVESGLINDPSRHYPGDVAIRNSNGLWEKAIEVRDKPVYESDVYIFARRCLSIGVRECAVVLASARQPSLNYADISSWADRNGIGITLFYGWNLLVDQALFWSEPYRVDAITIAVERIEARLIGVEASPASVMRWQELTRAQW